MISKEEQKSVKKMLLSLLTGEKKDIVSGLSNMKPFWWSELESVTVCLCAFLPSLSDQEFFKAQDGVFFCCEDRIHVQDV